MTRIFVTGAGGGVGQGIIKSLRLIEDLDLYVVAADMNALSPGLYAADLACVIPPASSPTYVEALVKLFADLEIDYYIPGTDTELQVCAAAADHVHAESGTRVVVAPPETIKIASDKYSTFQFLRSHGFDAPLTCLPNDIDPRSFDYPLVVKPRGGTRSIGFRLVHSPNELDAAIATQPDCVVQEFVGTPDSEYTCTVVGLGHGNRSAAFVLRRWLRDGDTYRATPVLDESVSRYVSQIAAKLALEGPCNFQLRVDGDTPKLLEINARCSGTTPLWSQLGFNPIEFYLKSAADLPYVPKVRYGVTVLRYWAEMIVSDQHVSKLSDGAPVPANPIQSFRL